MHLLALAGLPGTGKSALAAELSRRLDVPVFDKDRVREALFGPHWVEYSRAQDDLCVRLLYEAVRDVHVRGRADVAILDGRTYTRAEARAELGALADELDATLRIVECTCPSETALARIAADRGTHSAADRDAALYRRLADGATPIPEPKLVVDTTAANAGELAEAVLRELSLSR